MNNSGIEYILVGCAALYRLDYLSRELYRMEYGKGWKKMDGGDYYMFTSGSNTSVRSLSILRITPDLALKITLDRGGTNAQFA